MDEGTIAAIADALVPVLAIAFAFLAKQVRDLVKSTETKVDDAIYEAAKEGLKDAIVDAEPERAEKQKKAQSGSSGG